MDGMFKSIEGFEHYGDVWYYHQADVKSIDIACCISKRNWFGFWQGVYDFSSTPIKWECALGGSGSCAVKQDVEIYKNMRFNCIQDIQSGMQGITCLDLEGHNLLDGGMYVIANRLTGSVAEDRPRAPFCISDITYTANTNVLLDGGRENE